MRRVTDFTVRRARTSDVPKIVALVEPLVARRILLGKERVDLYGAVQEFRVAESADGEVIGCGALHVMWEDLGEVRTLAVDDAWLAPGRRARAARRARDATRATSASRGCSASPSRSTSSAATASWTWAPRPSTPVYAELVRSHDEGVAEFLDLARVKQNTLGNTRMLKHL